MKRDKIVKYRIVKKMLQKEWWNYIAKSQIESETEEAGKDFSTLNFICQRNLVVKTLQNVMDRSTLNLN